MPSLSRVCKPLALSLLLLGPLPAAAQAERTLTVTGAGTAAAAHDQAEVHAGVISAGRTAAEALGANNAAMEHVMATLRAAGIPATRLQTSNLSVQPDFAPPRPGERETQRITGYRVSNSVTVRVEDLSQLGALLDALARSGATGLVGVSFSIANPRPLLENARRNAVADARGRAQVLAMQEGEAEVPRPALRTVQAMDLAPTVPITAGENDVRAAVTMVFQIEN